MTWISTVNDFVCRHMLRHMIRLAYVLGGFQLVLSLCWFLLRCIYGSFCFWCL